MTEKSTENQKPFSDKIAGILNYSALNLALAIGYRTGLFDVMDTFDTPQTLEGDRGQSRLESALHQRMAGRHGQR